jgi:flagellar motor switch/type III secretory pathway protein FliN
MNDFFTTKGTLTLSIGEGYISSFEASTLRKDDVVRTTHAAGYPSTLFFNGMRLGRCDVVNIAGVFCARIVTAPYREQPLEEPGIKDDLIELLPTLISLGSIRMSPAELKGVGPRSIVSLGKPFSADEDAELLVGGIPAARGKVVCLGEEMGMRITQAYGTAFREANVRASGFRLEKGAAEVKVKDYDFMRPDKFSLNCIMKVAEIHGSFMRNLAARLPETFFVNSVDQCTYGEALAQLPEAEFAGFAAENAAWRPAPVENGGSAKAYAGPAGKMLVEEEGTAHPVPKEARQSLEKWWKENVGMFNRSPVYLYYRKASALRVVFDAQSGRDTILSCLRGGWKNVVDLNLKPYTPARGEPDFPFLHQNEMIVIVWVKDRAEGKISLVVVYPFLTLEPFLGILG